jgi:hypothetical protein
MERVAGFVNPVSFAHTRAVGSQCEKCGCGSGRGTAGTEKADGESFIKLIIESRAPLTNEARFVRGGEGAGGGESQVLAILPVKEARPTRASVSGPHLTRGSSD